MCNSPKFQLWEFGRTHLDCGWDMPSSQVQSIVFDIKLRINTAKGWTPDVSLQGFTLQFILLLHALVYILYICACGNWILILWFHTHLLFWLSQHYSITYFVASPWAQILHPKSCWNVHSIWSRHVRKIQYIHPGLFSLVNPQCTHLWCRQVSRYIFTINNSTAYIIDWLKCTPLSLQKHWFISAMIFCQEQNYPLH